MTISFRFPRCAHLRVSAEFQLVFGEGKRISGQYFRLQARVASAALQPCLGMTVSKRVDKRSVGRNRIRRQMREVFRLERHTLPAGDYVLLATPGAAKADNSQLRSELLSLLDRARTLKAVAPDGTMPPSNTTAGREFPSES